jgi:hypothetical protein
VFVTFDRDEAWSIMMLVVSQVIDAADLSDAAKKALRTWRSDRDAKSPEMRDLTESINEALAGFYEQQTKKRVRRLKPR